MEVADDLLAGEQGVVTDVVDRDFDADRFPRRAIEAKFTRRAPRLCFQPFGGLAEERLLGRVDHP